MRRFKKFTKFGPRTPGRPRKRPVTGGSIIGALSMLNHKVKRNTTKIRTALSSEKRRLDTVVQSMNTALGLSGLNTSIQCISLTSQGDGSTNREGNQIHCYKIKVKGHVFLTANNTGSSVCRVILFRSRDICGLTVGTDDLVQNDNARDPLNRDLADLGNSVTILAERYIVLAANGAVAQFTVAREFEFDYRPPKGEITTYNGTSAAISAAKTNHYFVYFIQSNTGASDVSGFCRAELYFNP